MDVAAAQYWSLARRPRYREAMEKGLADMVRACTLTIAEDKPGAECVGDHTPRLLWPYVPDSRLIHITRDGRDVLVSWTFHQLPTGFPLGEPFASQMAPQRKAFDADPFHFSVNASDLLSCEAWVRESAKNWSCYMQWDRDTTQRIAAGELRARVHATTYERLHTDVERERRELYRFLSVDPDEAAPVGRDSLTAPGRDGEDPKSQLRSAKVGEWKKYFTEDARRWFKEAAGPSLIEFGYEKDDSW